MKQYQDLLKLVLAQGYTELNERTGKTVVTLPGASMRFDLRDGFPAITVRKLAFKTAMAELCGFLRGYTSAADFRALGCGVWDQNANETPAWVSSPWRLGEDHLGPIYGSQWRHWKAYRTCRTSDVSHAVGERWSTKYSAPGSAFIAKSIDQLGDCVRKIILNPSDRGILFHAWNPAELDRMALRPCHVLYQFLPSPSQRQLSMSVYIRSNDLGLGAPFNMAEAGALLSLVARLTGYEPRFLNYHVGDAHIYQDHAEMIEAVLSREPLPPPTLEISSRVPSYSKRNPDYGVDWLDRVSPDDFTLLGYSHHPAISAPMAL